jgi:hypothetical protein
MVDRSHTLLNKRYFSTATFVESRWHSTPQFPSVSDTISKVSRVHKFLRLPLNGIRSIAMQWNWKQAGVVARVQYLPRFTAFDLFTGLCPTINLRRVEPCTGPLPDARNRRLYLNLLFSLLETHRQHSVWSNIMWIHLVSGLWNLNRGLKGYLV